MPAISVQKLKFVLNDLEKTNLQNYPAALNNFIWIFVKQINISHDRMQEKIDKLETQLNTLQAIMKKQLAE